jgi:hypothetical protein
VGFSPASPGAIGGTTPAAGSFTTLSASSGATMASDLRLGVSSNRTIDTISGNRVVIPSIGVSSSGSIDFGGSDTILLRDAANTLALRNGTNALKLRLYNTYTDGSNFERVSFDWSSNVAYVSTSNSGTGSARDLALYSAAALQLHSGNTQRWVISTTPGMLTGQTIGSTVAIKSGANAKAGTFTLSSGAATVSNTSVTANSVVQFTIKTSSGTPDGTTHVSSTSVGTSFTVAGNAGDNSTYNYVILEVNRHEKNRSRSLNPRCAADSDCSC